eukprot:NODE_928_length_1816_cov_23.816638_g816_i0.p1 GENE.NODE_928_length_1816_cov_23.816638_g816_i0~~NODE_928_length_1816_cov_23.816638_g816_i0.p1  ORF type:complete len:394 (-),score=75.91 NODE_928_length_1816_cov_23.816638_g816_i0:513-1694(-)
MKKASQRLLVSRPGSRGIGHNQFVGLAAEGVRGLQPYVPGKPIEELEREFGISNVVKLASNENPLPVSSAVSKAVQAALEGIQLYPDASGYHLRRAIAESVDVDPEMIMMGNGSNDVLCLIAETFLSPNVEAIYAEYSFVVYRIAVQAASARARVAAAHPSYHATQPLGHNLETMRELIGPQTRIVFIANPNNPTGTWLTGHEIREFLQNVPRHVIVVIDEAYSEYAEGSAPGYENSIPLIEEFPNVIVVRTFSKAYGLAGLRIGFGVSHPDIIELLNRVRQPFNVSNVGQAAAIAALEDKAFIDETRRVNTEGMAQLRAGFAELGIKALPSCGNFLLIDLGKPVLPYYERLLLEGIILRPVINYGLPNHLRVTVGLPEQNARVLEAFKTILD